MLWRTGFGSLRRLRSAALKDPGGFGSSSGQGVTRQLWVNASVNQRSSPGEQQGSGAAYRIFLLSVAGSVAEWHDPGCSRSDVVFRMRDCLSA